MNKIEEIFKAWNIAFDPDKEQAELAAKRIEICNNCDKKVTNLGINRCSVCGCALKGKVFSPVKGACPEGKWDEVDGVFSYTADDKIFVQIASYRDPELLPTIKDCIAKAKYPERLTFGICWQHSEEDEWDNLDEYKDNPNFTIMDVPWNESKGLCWARHHIQKMWKGEKYTMQIDSHHRFAEHWDEVLVNMMNLTGSSKPILSSYAGMYNPSTNELLNHEPYKMVGRNFTGGGTILFYPESLPTHEHNNMPVKARFVSGHFFFTIGKHCQEYKYDPNLYFAGDEISLSIRSFTLGYDLFHPHRLVIWHEYTREGRIKHWDDFIKDNAEKTNALWHDLDNISKQRLRQMLREEDNGIDLGEYDLGTVRSHEEYEIYAGINFAKRILHPDTKKGKTPPTTVPEDTQWRDEVIELYTKDIEWKPVWDQIQSQFEDINNIQFIYVGAESKTGNLLQRRDLTSERYITGTANTFRLEVESSEVPEKVIIWPYSKDGQWMEKLELNF